MRVNARFEGVAEKQVEYLAATTGLKVSEVLRQSVDHYYQHVRGGSGQLKHLYKFIGKGDSGESDVSANVKKYLDDGLAAKYERPPAKKAVRALPKKAKPAA